MTDKAPPRGRARQSVSRWPACRCGGQRKTVQLNDGGVVKSRAPGGAERRGLLEAAGVPLEQSDKVVPVAWSPVVDGMQIQVTRIRIDKVTERVPRPRQAHRGRDAEHEPSGRRGPGTPGTQDVTFAIARVNGVKPAGCQ